MTPSFLRNPFAFLLARSRRDAYLEEYVILEYRNGRPLAEILDDPYVRNRTTPSERRRLLESPELVAAIGEHALAELRLALAAAD